MYIIVSAFPIDVQREQKPISLTQPKPSSHVWQWSQIKHLVAFFVEELMFKGYITH